MIFAVPLRMLAADRLLAGPWWPQDPSRGLKSENKSIGDPLRLVGRAEKAGPTVEMACDAFSFHGTGRCVCTVLYGLRSTVLPKIWWTDWTRHLNQVHEDGRSD